MKEAIINHTAAVQAAKQKQKDNEAECKKLQKDMEEFKNNKDGKIEELKVGFLVGPIVGTVLIVIGEHLQAKGSSSETCCYRKDETEGTPDRDVRARYVLNSSVYFSDLL